MRGRRIEYSADEVAFVEQHHHVPRRELHALFVAAFGRVDVTSEHLKRLCLRHGWGNHRQVPWTRAQDAMLRALYSETDTAAVARRVGRSLTSTYSRAQLLGLTKSAAFHASEASGRLRSGDARGATSRFAKGNVPANKGKRRPGFAPGRMKDTQFVKGQRARNWRPIGSERIALGYRWTKVSDQSGVSWTANWRQTHILQWEAQNGPVPNGMRLKSLDGNRLNADPANWTPVPLGVLPRLHGKSGRDYDRAPDELKPAIMAIAKLEHAVAKKRRSA